MTCKRCGEEMPENALYCPFCGRAANYTRAKKKRGNGQGTAYKRGNSWTAEITDYYFEDSRGKHRKKKTRGGFATKADALAWCAGFGYTERETPTLITLYQEFERNSLPKLSKDKQYAYKKARERLEPLMGKKIDSLTTADLQKVVNEQSSSFYTARDMKVLLSHLYKAACANQFVQTNLSQYIVLPSLEEKESQPFTAEEVDKLWVAWANGDVFIGYLLLMIYSGMMPAELFACQKAMIDLDKCEIYGCGKKTRKGSVIVFADVVRPVVEELCAQSNGDKLCPRYKTEWYKDYHAALKRVGVRNLPPYSCRHTTGTEAARKNLSAPVIQLIMRHSKISTSQRYIHLGAEDAHSGLNSITRALPAKEAQTIDNTAF